MNPDREKLTSAARWATLGFGVELEHEEGAAVVDAVLAVLQQDKTTEDQVVSASEAQVVTPVSEPEQDMRVTHRDGRVVYGNAGDAYEVLFGAGTTLNDILLLEARQITGDWRTCYDGRHYAGAAGSLADTSEPGGQNQESSSVGSVSAEGRPAVDPVSEQLENVFDRLHADRVDLDAVMDDIAHDLVWFAARAYCPRPGEDPCVECFFDMQRHLRAALSGMTAGSMAEPSEPTPAETTESSEPSPQSSSGSCGPGGEGERE